MSAPSAIGRTCRTARPARSAAFAMRALDVIADFADSARSRTMIRASCAAAGGTSNGPAAATSRSVVSQVLTIGNAAFGIRWEARFKHLSSQTPIAPVQLQRVLQRLDVAAARVPMAVRDARCAGFDGGGASTRRSGALRPRKPSNVEVANPQCIGFDERAAGFDLLAHQRREDLFGADRVL